MCLLLLFTVPTCFIYLIIDAYIYLIIDAYIYLIIDAYRCLYFSIIIKLKTQCTYTILFFKNKF